MKTAAAEKKLFLLRFATVILSAAVLCFAVFLFLDKSGAWLRDEGDWTKSEYVLGKIDYVFSINGAVLDTKDEITYDAAIPIVGGVKINDTAANEPYAEENFNEGVTAAHFKVENTSDIRVNMTVEMQYTGFFDSADGRNLFYLILPEGAAVDSENHTVKIEGREPLPYKDYIKTCMGSYATLAEMKTSLAAYHAANPALYARSKSFSAAGGEDVLLEFDVLFWSEYDAGEIGGTDVSASDWKDSDGTVNSISANFRLEFQLKQPEQK